MSSLSGQLTELLWPGGTCTSGSSKLAIRRGEFARYPFSTPSQISLEMNYWNLVEFGASK